MASSKGYGITFMDLDETLFKTFAKINVVKNGKIINSLSNKEFNVYKLNEGESFDFSQFDDAKLFKETSIPIPRTVNMLKQMIKNIKAQKSFSRIILLTARSDFPNKELFLETFSTQGIDVSNKNIFYIERAGNIPNMSVAEKKTMIVLKYLKAGIYTRCRMVDDDSENLKAFLALEKELPIEIKEKVRKEYDLKYENPIKFYALQIQDDGGFKKLEL
ncbi:MAG: hypothetical protein ACP5N2_01165 [Candidatus Nanoarchaeia archaeon]